MTPTYGVKVTTNALNNIITRFTTPTLIMEINEPALDLSLVKAMNVTISQGRTRVKKSFPDEVSITGGKIYTTLSQADTGNIFVGLCDIQIHGKMKNDAAWQTTIEELYCYGSNDGAIDNDQTPVTPGDGDIEWEEF